jgi:hypothetical protein
MAFRRSNAGSWSCANKPRVSETSNLKSAWTTTDFSPDFNPENPNRSRFVLTFLQNCDAAVHWDRVAYLAAAAVNPY